MLPPGTPFFGPGCLKEVVMGDVEKGFQEAEVITEGTFGYENLPNPIPPEPPGAVALWEEPNTLTVWVSSQTPTWTGLPCSIFSAGKSRSGP